MTLYRTPLYPMPESGSQTAGQLPLRHFDLPRTICNYSLVGFLSERRRRMSPRLAQALFAWRYDYQFRVAA